jgi:hypothetical protein
MSIPQLYRSLHSYVEQMIPLRDEQTWLVADQTNATTVNLIKLSRDFRRVLEQDIELPGTTTIRDQQGKWLLASTDQRVSLYDMMTWQEVIGQNVPSGQAVVALDWSPDGRFIAINTASSLIFWTLEYVVP